MQELRKAFDRHRQLTLSPQLVKFSRLSSISNSECTVKPDVSRRPSSYSTPIYRVPIKPKMPIGPIRKAVAEINQVARELVGPGKLNGLIHSIKSALYLVHLMFPLCIFRLTAYQLVVSSISRPGTGNSAVLGTSLDLKEDGAQSSG